jgi:hypothetical protein
MGRIFLKRRDAEAQRSQRKVCGFAGRRASRSSRNLRILFGLGVVCVESSSNGKPGAIKKAKEAYARK